MSDDQPRKKIRHVDWSAGDFLAGMAGHRIGAAGWGVYIGIISLCYAEGRPSLPEKEVIERLARMMPADPRTIRAALAALEMCAKIKRDGGEIEPRRVRDELEMAARRVRDASEAARERWKSKGLGNEGALLTPPPAPAPASPSPPTPAPEARVGSVVKVNGSKIAHTYNERVTSAFMQASGWRNDVILGTEIFRHLSAGVPEDVLMEIANSMSGKPEPKSIGAYLHACVKRTMETRRAVISNLPTPEQIEAEAELNRKAERYLAAFKKAENDMIPIGSKNFPRPEQFGLPKPDPTQH